MKDDILRHGDTPTQTLLQSFLDVNGERLIATAGGALVAGVLALAGGAPANATVIVTPRVIVVPRVVVPPRPVVVPRVTPVPHAVEVAPSVAPHPVEVVPHPSTVPLPKPAPRAANAPLPVDESVALVAPIPQAAPRPAAPIAQPVKEDRQEDDGSWFSWPNSWAFWRSSEPATATQVVDDAKKALDDHAPLDQLQAAVDARLDRLHDAARKLDTLQAAVKNVDGLDDDDRLEAIRQAGRDYNGAIDQLGLPDSDAVPEGVLKGSAEAATISSRRW